jgi:hypothetical protein
MPKREGRERWENGGLSICTSYLPSTLIRLSSSRTCTNSPGECCHQRILPIPLAPPTHVKKLGITRNHRHHHHHFLLRCRQNAPHRMQPWLTDTVNRPPCKQKAPDKWVCSGLAPILPALQEKSTGIILRLIHHPPPSVNVSSRRPSNDLEASGYVYPWILRVGPLWSFLPWKLRMYVTVRMLVLSPCSHLHIIPSSSWLPLSITFPRSKEGHPTDLPWFLFLTYHQETSFVPYRRGS